MMTQELTSRDMQLQALCDGVRKYAKARDYQKCAAMICECTCKMKVDTHTFVSVYFHFTDACHTCDRRGF